MKNIFVIGMDGADDTLVHDKENNQKYSVHALPLYEVLKCSNDQYSILGAWESANAVLSRYDSVDAIVGKGEFPVTAIQSLLCKKWGVPSASIESILRCEHQFWRRLLLKELIPEAVSPFELLQPFNPYYADDVTLPYPFYIRPVMSIDPNLVFTVNSREELIVSVSAIRERMTLTSGPLDLLLDSAAIPSVIRQIDTRYCMVETCVIGEKYSLEGYIYNNKITIYQHLDLSEQIKMELEGYTHNIISFMGLDNCAFETTFSVNNQLGEMKLIEIKPKLSPLNAYLFEEIVS
jgi:hypothetical protein